MDDEVSHLQEAMTLWLKHAQETATAVPPSAEALAMREEDMKAAIALWEQGRNKSADAPRDAAPAGRANGFDLLVEAAAVLAGKTPPSPALATWFAGCVQALAAGASADDAFFAKRRTVRYQGEDIDMAQRDWLVQQAVEQAIAAGFRPGGLEEKSAFDKVAKSMPVSPGTAKKSYYESWEIIDDINFGLPPHWPGRDKS